MRLAIVLGGLVLLSACSVEPGSEKWCQQKEDQPKSEWTSSDAITYARNCILDSTTIGSKEWCEHMGKKPKGEWTAEEAASYAKHCVI
jgi:hypothetical protein